MRTSLLPGVSSAPDDTACFILSLSCPALQYGNSWRTAGDITQSWPEIMRVLDSSVGLMKYSKPYAWADLDMLEVFCCPTKQYLLLVTPGL